uniref:ribosomal protein L16 n=1 Tax=Portulaca gilliesii TaxID=1150899 RepID=UPI002008ECD0|nr:ribosomal protein L16 [Portulaca gilliesii]UOX27313.1 ribosomal protein L16 [Portulaca gilliesii]
MLSWESYLFRKICSSGTCTRLDHVYTNRSRAASNDTKCTSRWKNMGTYISRQTSYCKTCGNPYGFGERISGILGSCCQTRSNTLCNKRSSRKYSPKGDLDSGIYNAYTNSIHYFRI